MKKLLTLFLGIMLSISLVGQNLVYITPNSAAAGQTLNVTLSGQGTHFSQGSNTVWFTAGTTTAFSMNAPSANSQSSISGTVYIPYSMPNGVYDVKASNAYDGTMTMTSAFTVATTNAQLVNVSPSQGNKGQLLTVSLSCQNANFASGTNTQVWFSQGSYTMMGTNTTVVNNNLVNTNLAISPNAPTGAYNTFAANNIDGTLLKASSFTVNGASIISAVSYPNASKPGKNISVHIPYINGISMYNAQLFYQKGSTTIPITIDYMVTEYGHANIPNYASLGSYDLFIVNYQGTFKIESALELVNSTVGTIDSTSVETTNYKILDIYGDQTHFTHPSTTIKVAPIPWVVPIDSIKIINDNHIRVYGLFVFYQKSPTPGGSWIQVFNSIDDTINYPFVAYFSGSVNGSQSILENVKYFPNPTDDVVRIHSEEFKGNEVNVEVFSQDGKLIVRRAFSIGEEVKIDLSTYPSGLYSFIVSSNGKSKSLSVIRK